MTATLLLIAGCGGSKSVEVREPDYVDHSVRTLAISPSSDLVNDLFGNVDTQLADAIGAQLAQRGYTVINAQATMAIVKKDGIPPADGLTPEALSAMGREGIDAALSVTSESSVMGGPAMRHVRAKLISTHTGKEVGEINWSNSWGGMPGSPADYTMRKGLDAAAKEIAEALAKLLG
jgi:hypothetical protein